MPRCPRCSSRLPQGIVCDRCRPLLGFSRLFVPFPYAHPLVSALIDALKYEGVRDVAPFLASYICITPTETKELSVIPVPLHQTRLRERGFNQSDLLASPIAENLGALYQNALVRTKETAQQVKLSRAERYENLKDAFSQNVGKDVRGKSVLVVDDVITTGVTMSQAAKTLKRAGAKEIWAAAAAQG